MTDKMTETSENSMTPAVLLDRLEALFAGTGIEPTGLPRSRALVAGAVDAAGFADHSRYIQRLYRYHDFCAVQLAEVLESSTGTGHLAVEQRRHETPYDLHNDQKPPQP